MSYLGFGASFTVVFAFNIAVSIVEDFAFLEWRKTQNPYDPLLLSFNEMGTDIKQLSHGVAAGNWPTANDPSESVFSILPPVHQVFGREKIMYIWLPTCERLEPVWSVLKKLSETPEWKI